MPSRSTIDIPARLLRKPFYLLLQHYKTAYKNYVIRSLFDSEKEEKKAYESSVNALEEVDKPIFRDDIENRWISEGIDFEDNHYNYEMDTAYWIRNNHKALITISIGIKSQMFKPDKKNIRSLTKGGDVQQKLLKVLSFDSRLQCVPKADVRIGMEIVETLFNYAREIIKRYYTDEVIQNRELSILNFLYSKIKEIAITESPNQEKQIISPIQKLQLFWTKGIPELFFNEDNLWECFERVDPKKRKAFLHSHAFVINAVHFFKTPKDGVICSMLSKSIHPNGDCVESFYQGVATTDDRKRYLYIQLFNESQEAPLGFTLKFDDIDNQELLIGHYSSYSQTLKKYVTKLVVFRRVTLTKKQRLSHLNLQQKEIQEYLGKNIKSKGLIQHNSNTIPRAIRAFLAIRQLNRLSMPSTAIRFLKELEDWLEDKHKFIKDEELLNLCNQFIVTYCFSQKQDLRNMNEKDLIESIRFDTIDITLDGSEVKFNAKYTHRNNGLISNYFGEVYKKGDNIEVPIHHSSEFKLPTIQRNYGLLTFTKANESDEFFTGILSGLGDKPIKPVAYRILLFKRESLLINKKQTFSVDNLKPEAKNYLMEFYKTHSNNLIIRT